MAYLRAARNGSYSPQFAYDREGYVNRNINYTRRNISGGSENGRRVRIDAGAICEYMAPYPRTGENQAALRPLYYDILRRYRYGTVRISDALSTKA